MAARKVRKHLSDDWRLKIQTSMIINRLENFVKGEVELSAAQVTAALGLLKKSLPDLQAVEMSYDQDKPMKVEHNIAETILQTIPTEKLEEILNGSQQSEDHRTRH